MLIKYCAGVGAGTRICGMRTGPFSPLYGIERLLKLTQAACVVFMYQRRQCLHVPKDNTEDRRVRPLSLYSGVPILAPRGFLVAPAWWWGGRYRPLSGLQQGGWRLRHRNFHRPTLSIPAPDLGVQKPQSSHKISATTAQCSGPRSLRLRRPAWQRRAADSMTRLVQGPWAASPGPRSSSSALAPQVALARAPMLEWGRNLGRLDQRTVSALA